MPRRKEALVPLTHDHHHALAQARRLRDAAALDEVSDRRNTANDFVNFYLGRALRHFREEEELFFAPLVDDPVAGELVLRAVAEHLRIHALARKLKRQLTGGEVEQALLHVVSQLLAEHVRFEEQELFPLIEELIPEDDLEHLATVGVRDV